MGHVQQFCSCVACLNILEVIMNLSIFLFFGIFLISLVLTMVGLGGGLVFSPLFVILGFAKSDAASASLFLNMVAGASAAYTYSRKKMVDFSLSVPLLLSASVTAPIGSYFNVRIDLKPFMIIMAVVLFMAGCRMLVSPVQSTDPGTVAPFKRIVSGIIIGGIIGTTSALLGIGGGVFVVPLLIYVLKTPTKIAAASSTFIVCFSSLTGFLGYVYMSDVNWLFILPAGVAAFAGGQVGAKIMSRGLKGKSIRVVFSIILFVLCVKLIYQSFFL